MVIICDYGYHHMGVSPKMGLPQNAWFLLGKSHLGDKAMKNDENPAELEYHMHRSVCEAMSVSDFPKPCANDTSLHGR